MTDGPDVSHIDRRQESRDRQQEATASSLETPSGGRPIGSPPVQMNEKLVGCGCFGCSSLVLLAGCLALLGIVLGFLLPDWRTNNRYIPSSCLVLDKTLDSQMFAANRRSTGGKAD